MWVQESQGEREGGGGSGSGRQQKVGDPALDVLLPVSNSRVSMRCCLPFRFSCSSLILAVRSAWSEKRSNPSICARASCGVREQLI